MEHPTAPPKVFVSYSHDCESHKQWVRELSEALVKNGIEVMLDQWDLRPGQDMAHFMERGLAESDRVLMICSENYVRKADSGHGGVGYEKMIVSAEILSSVDTSKFIPILRNNESPNQMPACLGPRKYISFQHDESFEATLRTLLRDLYDLPPMDKPELGSNPFVTPPVTQQVETAMAMETPPSSALSSGFIDGWFDRESLRADSEFRQICSGVKMEIRSSLVCPTETYSPSKLLQAARKAEIKTFGWPIGVIIDTREDFCPKPREDGIYAELAIPDRPSFDFWAIRSNGDFFVSKSIFEDSRNQSAIFFDTRIIRTTETLLYLHKLHSYLSGVDERELKLQIRYEGIKGRQLANANPRRMIFSKQTESNSSTTEITVAISEIEENLTRVVQQLTAPLFEQFDFQTFADEVYEDIVIRYSRGEIS